ncbi:hypothetical protein [Candidatus Protochlamydia sp. W-9]|uniref:hypothetical protein n=1 Tax=Candidatus Protochlamydia sp. W-9 TaxID=1785087 RepID=UPI0011781C05|nr:hypothetical protein [Candidatus Protochlamydia sp. W-9]
MLAPLLDYFDRIQLPDDVVKEILEHLRKVFEHEQEFFNQAQSSLRKELDQVQKRLSRLIDEHLDGKLMQRFISKSYRNIRSVSEKLFRKWKHTWKQMKLA